MTEEKLHQAKELSNMIKKIEDAKKYAMDKLHFSNFPEMPYSTFANIYSMVRDSYDTQISNLQKQFDEL